MGKRFYIIIGIMLMVVNTVWGQRLAVKNNLLYDATLTPNLGVEYRFSEKITGQFIIGYNAWNFPSNKKWKHILIQPEVKYWLGSTYSGHFFGAHVNYCHYNVGNIDLPFGIWDGLEQHRYQGNLGAIGISYGYHWRLNRHWGIEGALGLGYGYTRYKKFNCTTCGSYQGLENRHLFLPTKLAVSVVYIL